jgi:hypothetical protein
MKKITLEADAELLRIAQLVAHSQGKSFDEVFRELAGSVRSSKQRNQIHRASFAACERRTALQP